MAGGRTGKTKNTSAAMDEADDFDKCLDGCGIGSGPSSSGQGK